MNPGAITVMVGFSAIAWAFPWTSVVLVPAAIWLWMRSRP